jgi:hypothetical protein
MRLLLLALLFLMSGCYDNHGALPQTGRYQLIADVNGNTWRLDTVSGETKRCWQGTVGVVAPQCITAEQK